MIVEKMMMMMNDDDDENQLFDKILFVYQIIKINLFDD